MPLQRTLEPEVMDSDVEARAYDQMDHSEVNRRFVEDVLAAHPTPADCIDLGSGPALIPIELCRVHPTCRVMAVDQSIAMLDLAQYRLEVESLTERVQLHRADARDTGFENGTFDCVLSNSIVHHIAEPEPVLREALRLLRPGGVVFFRDLMRPDTGEDVDRLVDLHAADAAELARDLLRASLHAALRLDEIRELVRNAGGAADDVQATSDRHWTWIHGGSSV